LRHGGATPRTFQAFHDLQPCNLDRVDLSAGPRTRGRSRAPRHSHTLEFQFIYVLKGWVLEITLPADFETREVK
jgi:hypothetical protein